MNPLKVVHKSKEKKQPQVSELAKILFEKWTAKDKEEAKKWIEQIRRNNK